jgi:NTP pyrophosphatase (non-canonical NTP hydrolase)
MTNFAALQEKALFIKNYYKQLQLDKGLEPWTPSDYMAGFVTDIGELSEYVAGKKGIRKVDDVDQKLEHELCDCLYSVIVLAEEFGIDLSEAFGRNMDELAERIKRNGY